MCSSSCCSSNGNSSTIYDIRNQHSHQSDHHNRDLEKLQLTSRQETRIRKQRDYLDSAAPDIDSPGEGHHTDDSSRARKDSRDFLRIRYAMRLANAALRFSLTDSLMTHQHTHQALEKESASLVVSLRERDVMQDDINKLSAACDLYENEFSSSSRNKQASHAYIADLESQLDLMHGDHKRAIYSESQAVAEQERLQEKVNRLEITQRRQDNEMTALKEDLERGSTILHTTKSDALELKRQLILAESCLGERDQRLEVLQIERDELARHYYRFQKADDPFSYTTAESEETGAASSSGNECEGITRDKDDGDGEDGELQSSPLRSKHRVRHHRRHHEHRSPSSSPAIATTTTPGDSPHHHTARTTRHYHGGSSGGDTQRRRETIF